MITDDACVANTGMAVWRLIFQAGMEYTDGACVVNHGHGCMAADISGGHGRGVFPSLSPECSLGKQHPSSRREIIIPYAA